MKSSYYNFYKDMDDKIKVMNAVTGKTATLSARVGKLLQENQLQDIGQENLDKLAGAGFVVDDEIDEIARLEQGFIARHTGKKRWNITLTLTLLCNCDCPYCFEEKNIDPAHPFIDMEALKKFSEKYLKDAEFVHFGLFGGEPLLAMEQLKEFFTFFRQFSEKNGVAYHANLVSNGVLLDNDRLKILVDLCHVRSIQITLDGYKNTHDLTRKLKDGTPTFDRIVANIKNAARHVPKYKISLIVRINLEKSSYEDVEQIFAEFEEEEKTNFYIYFRNIFSSERYEAEPEECHLDIAYLQKRATELHFRMKMNHPNHPSHCSADAGETEFYLLPGGTIWKCINDMKYPQNCIGRMNEEGDIEYNEYAQVWEKESPFEDEECRICTLLPICWGGCPMIKLKTGEHHCIYEKTSGVLM